MPNIFKKTSTGIFMRGDKLIQINANFSPFRMKLDRREPVSLGVEIANKSNEPKILTMSIALSGQLSFEKGGYKTEQMERIEKLPPGEKKLFYYSIFPKAGTRATDQPVIVKVAEHYQNFNYVTNEYKKNLVLKVED